MFANLVAIKIIQRLSVKTAAKQGEGMVMNKYKKYILGVAIIFSCQSLMAELKPIADEALSDITGQAYLSVDKTYHPEDIEGNLDYDTNVSYTRINFGMDIETLTNADVLEMGRYHRWANTEENGAKAGTICNTCNGSEAGLEAQPSDLLIKDFGLGYINNKEYSDANPQVPMLLKDDGTPYGEGEIVPFKIKNPFLEFAHDETTGEVIGVRIGFGETKGILSGVIESLSGAVNVDIRDAGSAISETGGGDGSLFEKILLNLTPLLVADGTVSTQAGPMNENNQLDSIRATRLGVPDGEDFIISGADDVAVLAVKFGDLIGQVGNDVRYEKMHNEDGSVMRGCGLFNGECNRIIVTVEDCQALGAQTCFDLDRFQALPIGKVDVQDDKNVITDSVSGLFLSFQTQAVGWSTTKGAHDAVNVEDFIRTTPGAFFNVPNGALEVNLGEVYRGTPMPRKEFIDRGVGLF